MGMMIYDYKITDEKSGEEAFKIAYWCGKNLKHDIDVAFNKKLMSVTVTFYIDEEDEEIFIAKWGT